MYNVIIQRLWNCILWLFYKERRSIGWWIKNLERRTGGKTINIPQSVQYGNLLVITHDGWKITDHSGNGTGFTLMHLQSGRVLIIRK